MDLVGKRVKHKAFGVGTVTAHDGQLFTVEFSAKTAKFTYPDAFLQFLTCEEAADQAAILQEIADAKAEKEALARAEAERKAAALAAKKEQINKAETKKNTPQIERLPGKHATFFVFQGGTYDREHQGGYLWAPVTNKMGQTTHHWERLLDVRAGDIIFHGCDGYIQAVSVAKGSCYDAPLPEEMRSEDLWELEGRRIDCEYVEIDQPIKTSTCADDIVRLCNGVKYSPFDRYGSGNMGYLYYLNRDLAKIFLQQSAKNNGYLESLDFLQELFEEM